MSAQYAYYGTPTRYLKCAHGAQACACKPYLTWGTARQSYLIGPYEGSGELSDLKSAYAKQPRFTIDASKYAQHSASRASAGVQKVFARLFARCLLGDEFRTLNNSWRMLCGVVGSIFAHLGAFGMAAKGTHLFCLVLRQAC
eukprot:6199054-Pleurochrysis_carterae.AAC.3